MKKEFQLKTPVLYLVFNRLDTVKKTFPEIQKAKPKQLFIASDGPRKEKNGEKKIVEEVRRYILSNIDWKCEVKTLFRKENLGCKYAVSGAIDWFFKNVEQGIILEDDCLPNQSFFRFCEEMLDKYKNEKKVMMVSGNNFIEEKTKNLKESYYFSRNAHIWGWATWKRAWKKYKVDLTKEEIAKIKNFKINFIEKYQLKKVIKYHKEKNATWDHQWQFALSHFNRLCIIPKINLVKNIGFEGEYTNTKPNKFDKRYFSREALEMQFPMKETKVIIRNKQFDRIELVKDLKRSVLKKLF
jgi:hypothetical protein